MEASGPTRRRQSTVIVELDDEEWNDFLASAADQPASQSARTEEELNRQHFRQSGNYSSKVNQFNLANESNVIPQEVGPAPQKEPSPKKGQETDQSSPSKTEKPVESPTKAELLKNPGHSRLKDQIRKNNLRIDELEGEIFVVLHNCSLYSENRIEEGRILLTNYRISYFSNERKKLDIPLGFVERVAVKQDKKNILMEIVLKYSPVWKFSFTGIEMAMMIDGMLNFYVFPQDISDHFAFSYAKYRTHQKRCLYSFEKEYERLGLLSNPKFKRLQNGSGRYCETYPPIVIVPYQALEEGDAIIRNVAKSRQRDRFPVATYLYSTSNTITSCLWRGAQIRASSDKWLSDVKYISYLSYGIVGIYSAQKLVVLETRSKQLAKNMEAPQIYKDIQIEYAGLDLVPSVKASYIKMIEACLIFNNTKFIRNVIDSKWYDQIRQLLAAAERVSNLLQQGRNVFVRCSDGWDRTTQICALAMLLLDPYYRTIDGFEVLVQKQFCSMGEPFHLRLGLKGRSEQQIPTFIQFLDCVSQIMYQYPLSFEFSYKYLSLLAHLTYTNKFGNFLVSCEKEASDIGIRERTVSIWEELREAPLSTNPFYSNQAQTGIVVLPLLSSIKANRFFREHFYYLTTSLRDTYKTHPFAEENDDYINLRHSKIKMESELLRKNVAEQIKTLRNLKQSLAQLQQQEQKDRQRSQRNRIEQVGSVSPS